MELKFGIAHRRRGRTIPVEGPDESHDVGGFLTSAVPGGGSSYSYSSVKVWHGGSDGQVYEKTETTTRGPGGVSPLFPCVQHAFSNFRTVSIYFSCGGVGRRDTLYREGLTARHGEDWCASADWR